MKIEKTIEEIKIEFELLDELLLTHQSLFEKVKSSEL